MMELYRILAIDYGSSRIGIALSDPLRVLALPHCVLKNDKAFWENLEKLIQNQNVKRVLIGLPLNYSGEETAKTREIRKFGEEFRRHFALPFEFVDEDFTSAEANEALQKMKFSISESRQVIDKVAAALILQNYLGLK